MKKGGPLLTIIHTRYTTPAPIDWFYHTILHRNYLFLVLVSHRCRNLDSPNIICNTLRNHESWHYFYCIYFIFVVFAFGVQFGKITWLQNLQIGGKVRQDWPFLVHTKIYLTMLMLLVVIYPKMVAIHYTPWSKYKRREYDVIFVKPTGSTKMAVKLRLLDLNL